MRDELIQLGKAVYNRVHKYLNNNCSEWRSIVEVAIRDGLDKAVELMQNAKESIVGVLKKNRSLVRSLTQGAVKSGAKMTAKCVAKKITKGGAKVTQELVIEGGKRLASEGTKKVATQGLVKQGLKSLGKGATVIGIAADFAQAGLEYCGYKKTGKAVGATGNAASGIMAGVAMGGPVGAIIGGFVAVSIWGAGEAVGTGINKALEQ